MKTVNTVIISVMVYPQNKKINFVIFTNAKMVGVNSNSMATLHR